MGKSSGLQDAGPGVKDGGSQSFVNLVCAHPADHFVILGPVTGTRYAFPRGIRIPVAADDAPGLLGMKVAKQAGCCGSEYPERDLFTEVGP